MTPRSFQLLAIISGLLAIVVCAGEPASTNPIEAGIVNWQRDFEAAARQAKHRGKPLFVLFQEIPGCAGCQKFGQEVLSHPLMAEAIEREFVPVLVYNNRDEGADAALRKRFSEPAWNYQVVRFLDSDGDDLIPRKDKIWSTGRLAERMIEALRAVERQPPKYLESLVSVNLPQNYEQAAFAMHCFWTGEYKLGAIDGVVTTEAGWLEGREVTRVVFDPATISLDALVKRAAEIECADKVYAKQNRDFSELPSGVLDETYRLAKADDQKRQLSKWPAWKSIPGLTPMQATKLNAIAPRSLAEAREWLSPNQGEHFESMLADSQPQN